MKTNNVFESLRAMMNRLCTTALVSLAAMAMAISLTGCFSSAEWPEVKYNGKSYMLYTALGVHDLNGEFVLGFDIEEEINQWPEFEITQINEKFCVLQGSHPDYIDNVSMLGYIDEDEDICVVTYAPNHYFNVSMTEGNFAVVAVHANGMEFPEAYTFDWDEFNWERDHSLDTMMRYE